MARRAQDVSVPIYELTNRQLHLHLIDLYERQVTVLNRLEKHMADVNQSLEDLEAAVDSINSRFAAQLLALNSALQEAKQALADEELDDAATQDALNQALADAETAANRINTQVQELNAIGAEPETEVEPDETPVDETPIEEPAEGTPTEEETTS